MIFILFYANKNETYKIRVLLFGSLVFYLYHEPILTPLLICFTGLSFIAGNWLAKYIKYKKIILCIFLFILFGCYYPLKYNDSFELILKNIFHFEGLRWLYLPLGLSFYTFKTMSYVMDIYYERSGPQISFQKYLLYVSFFPQIFCGPIMRPDEFFLQLKFSDDYDHENVFDGLRLIVLGMFKKIILASNLSLLVREAYAKPLSISGFEWVVISIITRFYIYYDFSGYSDISNGVSLTFGIKVLKNFNRPFTAKSITDFWRRWHISLSTWIRDYVYYPMVSKFSNYAGIYISLIVSFIFLGLWHGDKINYILYGLINGLAVAISTYFAKKNRNSPPATKFKLIVSRISLYLFLIFLPSILLMAHDSITLFQIIKSFTNLESWFGLGYFSNQKIMFLAYLVIPPLSFGLLSTIYGENLKKHFSVVGNTYRLVWLLLGIFITFTLISPKVNYQFLYQGF